MPVRTPTRPKRTLSPKRRAIPGRNASPRRARNASKGAIPAWVNETVFRHAKIVYWEGIPSPLRATRISPASGSFVASILPKSSASKLTWADAVHPLDRQKIRRHFDGLNGDPCDIDYRLIDRNGSVIWVRHSVVQLEKTGRRAVIRGFVRDIQSEKELELESLRVSESEQNRIGQDLHDDLCQVLAGVSCLMRVMESRIADKVPEEAENFKEINQQIVDAMLRTRALTHGLFPGKVQMADIRGALLELASQVHTRFKVDVRTQFVGRFPKHSSTQIIQIYRLAQEALSNAIKHGSATEIEVRLEAKASEMILSISDNGCGFGKSGPEDKGVGLHIMKYRTSTLGGALDIRNHSTRGAIVELRYPFEN